MGPRTGSGHDVERGAHLFLQTHHLHLLARRYQVQALLFSAAPAGDLGTTLQKVSPYPPCAVSTHRLAPSAAPGVSVIAHRSWEA